MEHLIESLEKTPFLSPNTWKTMKYFTHKEDIKAVGMS